MSRREAKGERQVGRVSEKRETEKEGEGQGEKKRCPLIDRNGWYDALTAISNRAKVGFGEEYCPAPVSIRGR